jgi:hypothetical protein
MITINTKKIAGLSPRWARFPGFSILFDPPEDCFRPDEALDFLSVDSGQSASTSLFFGAMDGMRQLDPDQMLLDHGFCALPFGSYHVTAFDVANVGDLDRCEDSLRETLKQTLDGLASADGFEADFLKRALSHELIEREWNIEFSYGRLRRWGSVVAIQLNPLNPELFEEFRASRSRLSQDYVGSYGVGADETFTPHVSVGYFLNRQCADLATEKILEWDALLRETIGGATVLFTTASLYGFSDMATFFRLTNRQTGRAGS